MGFPSSSSSSHSPSSLLSACARTLLGPRTRKASSPASGSRSRGHLLVQARDHAWSQHGSGRVAPASFSGPAASGRRPSGGPPLSACRPWLLEGYHSPVSGDGLPVPRPLKLNQRERAPPPSQTWCWIIGGRPSCWAPHASSPSRTLQVREDLVGPLLEVSAYLATCWASA